jgi:hypothetical protein
MLRKIRKIKGYKGTAWGIASDPSLQLMHIRKLSRVNSNKPKVDGATDHKLIQLHSIDRLVAVFYFL